MTVKTAKVSLEEALKSLPEGKRFTPVFRHGSLLVEIYAPRGHDPQQPHTRDEVYVVARGSGEFVTGGERVPVGPNDFLFAAANVPHRFDNFTDDFAVWILFYGPEGGEADQSFVE